MSKLPKEHKFIDLSDYGRPIARLIANSLKNTSYTPVDVTIWFIISGLIGITCMVFGYYWAAAFFLLFKSVLDAADGELARVKETPSYTGRFLDSIADFHSHLVYNRCSFYILFSYFFWDSIARYPV
jgi:phosphatidylglycerophosphate synthase